MKRLAILVVTFLLLGASLASAQAPCSLNTVRGTYALELKGQMFQGGLSAVPGPGGLPLLQGMVLPLYFSGLMTVAGDGTATGGYWGLLGIVPAGYGDPVPWAATFTVNPDCTGELTYPNLLGGVNVEKMVVLDNGGEVRTVAVESPGMPWHLTAVRISRANGSGPMCAPNSFRGTYVMECDGIEMASPGPPPTYSSVAPLFHLKIAADGTVTGRQFGLDHPIDGLQVSGEATVNPDCSVQALLQTEAVPGATILTKGVLYDNGKEMFGGPLIVFLGGQEVVGVFAGFGCHMTRLDR